MADRSPDAIAHDWRRDLPILTGRDVALREPRHDDVEALVELLAQPDAARFGVGEPVSADRVLAFIARAQHDRLAGTSLTYVVAMAATQTVVGLVSVRRLDPTFEAAEWDMTLAPAVRGTGVFLDAARVIASFVFSALPTYRLESRVPVQNGRANGALKKLGAVQEGVLRRSLRRGDDYLDQVLWSLLKDDWSEQWVTGESRVH